MSGGLRPRSSPSSARAAPTGSRRPERPFCGRATQPVVYGAAKPCIGNRRNGDCIPAAIFGDVKQIEQAGGRFHKVAAREKRPVLAPVAEPDQEPATPVRQRITPPRFDGGGVANQYPRP